MKDRACVDFLQWALPKLDLRWPGYRKVRGTVCKRLRRRTRQLGLHDLNDYRHYLCQHPDEWTTLDSYCRIPISRFYRDKAVFDALASQVIPELAALALNEGRTSLGFWSVGAASGEEAYTFSLLWHLSLAPQFPRLEFDILSTDADPVMIERARKGVYAPASLRDLPATWRERAFTRTDDGMRLKSDFRECVRFVLQDIRSEVANGPFDLIACRNLVFTYFGEPLRSRLLEAMTTRLRNGGILLIGGREHLPDSHHSLRALDNNAAIFAKLN